MFLLSLELLVRVCVLPTYLILLSSLFFLIRAVMSRAGLPDVAQRRRRSCRYRLRQRSVFRKGCFIVIFFFFSAARWQTCSSFLSSSHLLNDRLLSRPLAGGGGGGDNGNGSDNFACKRAACVCERERERRRERERERDGPNHQRWYAKWKLSRNMYALHARFCTFDADLHAQSALRNKISASDLSRKFIESALLVGEVFLLRSVSWKRRSLIHKMTRSVFFLFFFLSHADASCCLLAIVCVCVCGGSGGKGEINLRHAN